MPTRLVKAHTIFNYKWTAALQSKLATLASTANFSNSISTPTYLNFITTDSLKGLFLCLTDLIWCRNNFRTMLLQVICNCGITFCRTQGLRVLGHPIGVVRISQIRKYPQPHLIKLPNFINAAGQHRSGVVPSSWNPSLDASCLRNAHPLLV